MIEEKRNKCCRCNVVIHEWAEMCRLCCLEVYGKVLTPNEYKKSMWGFKDIVENKYYIVEE